MSRILIIAGTDSSGRAGLVRDVIAAGQHSVETSIVVTAVTAQSREGIHETHFIPPEIIAAQMRAVFADGIPDAIKIGMLGQADTVMAIAAMLADINIPIVLDPVVKSTSGSTLLTEKGLTAMKRHLFPLTTLVTPNLSEAALLARCPAPQTQAIIAEQARKIVAAGANAILVKGGHGCGNTCTDHLFDHDMYHAFSVPRGSKTRRGTGCTLATAIACKLAQGLDLPTACEFSQRFVSRWISSSEPA